MIAEPRVKPEAKASALRVGCATDEAAGGIGPPPMRLKLTCESICKEWRACDDRRECAIRKSERVHGS